MDIFSIIKKVIQLLIILIIGVIARKKDIITKDSIKTISRILTNVCNVLLIICSFQLDYTPEILSNGLQIMLFGVVVHTLSCFIAYFVFSPKKNDKRNKVYELATIFSNCGFMGFPVLSAVYGDLGVVYGAFYNVIFQLFFWTYGIIILSRNNPQHKVSLKKLIINPGIISTVIGFSLYLLKIRIPEAIFGGMDMVGDATFPLSMLIIGALICELDIKTALLDIKLYICSLLKLLAFPFITLAICLLTGVNDTVTYVAVILSGMPSATFTAIFSEVYGTDSVTSAKAVSMTTLFSIVTIPIIVYVTQYFIAI